jgi:mono/diheme cytochrome c family protein
VEASQPILLAIRRPPVLKIGRSRLITASPQSAVSAMKRLVVFLKYFLFVLIIAIGGVAIHVWRTWDRVYDFPLPDLRASSDPAIIQRGEYLVYGPAHCVECHASSYAEFATLADGKKPALIGGEEFAAPPLGALYSKNLTPDAETGIGRYSDGQIARMMRWSVRPNGRASVRALMPFHNMSNDDTVAIISFLRQQPPVRHEVPANRFTLIGKVLKSFGPAFKPRDTINPPAVSPPSEPTKERGEYLARFVADCVGCHTKLNQVTFSPVGPEFAGGEEQAPLDLPDADKSTWFVTPNITPAKDSALMKFPDRATFVARFKVGGRHYAGSPMPWEAFARMSESDIAALYEFLHSLPPQSGPTGEPTFTKAN